MGDVDVVEFNVVAVATHRFGGPQYAIRHDPFVFETRVVW